jgi:pilus assembly protein CpaC
MNTRTLQMVRLLLALAVVTPGLAQAQGGSGAVIQVEVGTHQLLREPDAITRVAVGDPAIADVNVINRRELLITGKSRGVTSLMVWTRGVAQPRSVRVRVGAVADPASPRQPDPELAGAVIVPGERLSGRLPNLDAHRRARQLAQAGREAVPLDTSVVDFETQVMTEIKIAEVSRSTAQQFGLNVVRNNAGSTIALTGPGGLSGVSRGPGDPTFTLDSAAGFVPLRNAFNLVLGDASRGVLGILSLLEGKGLARTLAEPSLVATSGQTASFLAGGEFPVPVSQGGAQAGGITIEFKEFGVRLNITPTVLSRDRISLKVAPEVSELDFTAAVQVGGVAVPALRVRRTDTTIELGDGESFVISGLVSNNLMANVDKVPWLGDVPILGAFFRSAQVSREQKELIMVVTPHLVRPMRREAQLPPLPGAQYDRYNPRFDQLMFQETGDFDNAEFGFGR